MLPKGIVSSGFPRVRETCRSVGIEFDDWQTDLNRCMLGKASDGLLAADTVALSIARQVGKTFDVGAVEFAECITVPETTVVWTAHRFKVARESFNELRSLAKSPKLVPHLDFDAITTAAGNESIPFRNGSRIVFAARERGAIRGFTKVRRLVLDEAQILTEAALSDLAPTMNQAVDPQIILMGTPPKPGDPSEVFSRIRTEALAGDSEGVLYVEFSADPDADLDDREQWRKANPSYPTRTPARAVLRMRKLLSADDFAREALGIWDAKANGIAIASEDWRAAADPQSKIAGKPALAVSMSPDRSTCVLSAAGWRSDELMHTEIVLHGATGAWFVEKVAEIARNQKSEVAVVPNHPAGSLIPELERAGVRLRTLAGTDYTRGCGAFYDLVKAGKLRYVAPQPELDLAVSKAGRKPVGDSWRWSGDEISALVAATQAVYAALTARKGGKGRAIGLN